MSPRRNSPSPAGGRSTNRVAIAMAVMGALVLCYGWNSFFLAPRGRAKAQVTKDLTAARKNETDLRQSLAQFRKLAANTTAREAELVRFGTLIPADPDLAGAILILNDTANQAGVTWSSFAPTPATAGAGAGPVTMSIGMKVGGTFSQIFDYLRRLETLDRLVVIDSLQLASGTSSNGGTKLDVDIHARMFAAGTGSAAPATTTAAKAPSSAAAETSPAALAKAGN